MAAIREFLCKLLGHRHIEVDRNYGMIKDDVTYRCRRCGNQYVHYHQ